MRFLMALLLGIASIGSQAALLGRAPLTPGGTDYQAYYDSVLDITWTADANLSASESFGLPRDDYGYIGAGELGPQGETNWYTALEWIDAMNSAAYLGQAGWRLPTIRPLNGVDFLTGYSSVGATDVGPNISAPGSLYGGSTAHEMAHLYYNTLPGNVGGYYPAAFGGQCLTFPIDGGAGWVIPSCLQNAGPFSNILQTYYWEGLSWSQTDAWMFDWQEGYQGIWWKTAAAMDAPVPADTNAYVHAWAVHDGDPFAVVPIPPAAWLFGSALCLLGHSRRPLVGATTKRADG